MKNLQFNIKPVLCALFLYIALGYLCQIINVFSFKFSISGIVTFLIGSFFYSLYTTRNNGAFLIYSIILFLLSFSLSL
ncbi:membrane-bound ClpP family serine protease [Streptococcus porcorum]|uniref:Membrane-bound ClpP family serine protease n=1 Tax=Streptococcus porcorum TaxID=701526 RepID=A0ABV2JD20_9STRE